MAKRRVPHPHASAAGEPARHRSGAPDDVADRSPSNSASASTKTNREVLSRADSAARTAHTAGGSADHGRHRVSLHKTRGRRFRQRGFGGDRAQRIFALGAAVNDGLDRVPAARRLFATRCQIQPPCKTGSRRKVVIFFTSCCFVMPAEAGIQRYRNDDGPGPALRGDDSERQAVNSPRYVDGDASYKIGVARCENR